jgi:putative thiamine transport system permease protein
MLRLRMIFGAAPLVLFLVLPLVFSSVLLVPGLLDWSSLVGIFHHPQFPGALGLTLWTGVLSTAMAFVCAVVIVASLHMEALDRAGWFLAVPHLALAIGLGFLIAPTGLLARSIALLVTDWDTPPAWQTVQDPWGFGLMAALVLKEVPFLVWAMAQVLRQDELRDRFRREQAVARSLGHSSWSSFMAVLLPQILRRVRWPLVAVFSYGMTVVDMALVIGPGQPPTLAQLVWTDLNDGDPATAVRGAAGTLVLSFIVVALIAVFRLTMWLLRPVVRRRLTVAPGNAPSCMVAGALLWRGWLLIYAMVVAALLIQSVSLLWPFPDLLASQFSVRAWGQMLEQAAPLRNTFVLAMGTSVLSLLACVVWFETQAVGRDALVLAAVTAVLCLPALLLALGQYRLLLLLGWTGTWAGMVVAHILFVMAYVFVMLHGPYRAYDKRWQHVSHGLNVAGIRFLLEVKVPMLRAPLAAALAVGFAVSVAQFVPAQLAAAGRFSTLPMEAVTLSAGGNRALIAVSALMLMALPLVVFQLATAMGRSRWRQA